MGKKKIWSGLAGCKQKLKDRYVQQKKTRDPEESDRAFYLVRTRYIHGNLRQGKVEADRILIIK